ncbi:MAG: 1-(5-phosphoribosyl)-5-[(5-phosphoribosylamino)methylideneamino]imidazole-4-carboxamide isomerase [Alphaproteobacteria bacterium]|nr:1-(5-phosphoribosyl)-5-[(5-phosphoribosylamino)methylideneamino]imidazole-4-carboxamide isomerase [Alphaproteobacteria bacterium]
MNLYPAIDLKDGACVRLLRGDMATAISFNADPADQALRFSAMGFERLHVVDLNGAVSGESVNHNAVASILDITPSLVQLGGGVRDMASIERWLDAGVARVILGTAAVRNPDLVKLAAREFPDTIAVAIDARDGQVAVQGWSEATRMQAVDLARVFEGCGVAAIIATDIGRDGTKSGVNIELTGQIADAVSIPVIASGGVRDVDDLIALKSRPGRPIEGAILGRALYDGDIDPAAALRAVR